MSEHAHFYKQPFHKICKVVITLSLFVVAKGLLFCCIGDPVCPLPLDAVSFTTKLWRKLDLKVNITGIQSFSVQKPQ